MDTMMEEKIANAKKEVLVEMVKLAQKRGMGGSQGGWKDFLKVYDTKFGTSLSDPSRRSTECLVAFLKTFTKKDDLKCFEKVLHCHSNRDELEQLKKNSPDAETPEQKLVRLTLAHPLYPIDYSFPSYEEEWLVSKCSKKSKATKSTSMVAVDCEMVLCEDGTEALVRVCVVDRSLQVKLDELVNPNKPVADFRTDITGVSASDIDGVTCTLTDVQKSIRKLLSNGTILVGHSLCNDLQALKLDHPRVIDTSYVFKYGTARAGRRPSLYDLCKSVLGYELREKGGRHNCLDDACAAMKLVLAKIERGVDNVIPVIHEEVPETDVAKLLIHRIPKDVLSEDLHLIIPGDFTVEVKAKKKAQGGKYSAFAIYKSQHEATEAFENLQGDLEKDSSGRPQKLIPFELKSGITGTLCVCKIAHGNLVSEGTLKKRSIEDDTQMGESKKSRTDKKDGELQETTACSDRCGGHLEEIERLKREVKQRDQEISNLNKIIVALTRKQGL